MSNPHLALVSTMREPWRTPEGTYIQGQFNPGYYDDERGQIWVFRNGRYEKTADVLDPHIVRVLADRRAEILASHAARFKPI